MAIADMHDVDLAGNGLAPTTTYKAYECALRATGNPDCDSDTESDESTDATGSFSDSAFTVYDDVSGEVDHTCSDNTSQCAIVLESPEGKTAAIANISVAPSSP